MAGTIEFELGEKSLAAIRSLTEALSRIQGFRPAAEPSGIGGEHIPANDTLTGEEVRKILHIAPSTMHKWRKDGRLRGGVMVGKQLQFPRSEVERILKEGTA